MSRDDVLALARQLRDAANCHDVPRLMTFYAEDAVAVSPMFNEVRGRASIAATWERLFSMLPDCALAVSDVLLDGDRLAIIGAISATDRSGWFGLPATGGDISYRVVVLCTLAAGKIVREERIYDSLGVLERLEKHALDKELRTAAEVQRVLLPRTAHVGPHCEATGDSVPCRAIGGDFFEFIELASGDFGIMLGDVAGKGAPAALLAALLQGMFIVDAAVGESPALTLGRLNQRLMSRRPESRFATLVYGVLSPDGRLVCSNAGHNPPAVLSRSGVQRLTAGGPPLGAFADTVFEEETLQLHARDTVVMFTDGFTDARNAGEEDFGEDRLLACATRHSAESPAVLLGQLFRAVQEFCQGARQGDDITAAILRFR